MNVDFSLPNIFFAYLQLFIIQKYLINGAEFWTSINVTY